MMIDTKALPLASNNLFHLATAENLLLAQQRLWLIEGDLINTNNLNDDINRMTIAIAVRQPTIVRMLIEMVVINGMIVNIWNSVD